MKKWNIKRCLVFYVSSLQHIQVYGFRGGWGEGIKNCRDIELNTTQGIITPLRWLHKQVVRRRCQSFWNLHCFHDRDHPRLHEQPLPVRWHCWDHWDWSRGRWRRWRHVHSDQPGHCPNRRGDGFHHWELHGATESSDIITFIFETIYIHWNCKICFSL